MNARKSSFHSALLLCAVLAVGLLSVPRGAAAQSFDSLQCYPIRDEAQQHGFVRLDVVPSDAIFTDDDGNHVDPLAGPGCRLILPAREFCTVVSATETGNPHPTPPAASPTPAPTGPQPTSSLSRPAQTDAGDFLCYLVSCGESSDRVRLEVEDPFAARSIEVLNRPAQLCLPAVRSGGTPTPAASGTPPPTGTPSSTGTPPVTSTPIPIQTGTPSPSVTSTPIPIHTATPSPGVVTPSATAASGAPAM